MQYIGPVHPTNYAEIRYPINFVVLHTMVGWLAGSTATFVKPYTQSAHYAIDLSGNEYQWLGEQYSAYATGDWDCNLESVSVEHEDGGNYNGTRPDALYTASAELVRDICQRTGVPIVRGEYPLVPGIIDHRTVSATACPDALDTDRIIREAAGMTESQMAELKAFISAQTNITVQAAIAIALRQMRGTNPGLAGNDQPLVIGEKIFQTDAK